MAVAYEYVGKTGGTGWTSVPGIPLRVNDSTSRVLATVDRSQILVLGWSRQNNAYLTLNGAEHKTPGRIVIEVGAGPVNFSSDASNSWLQIDYAFLIDAPDSN